MAIAYDFEYFRPSSLVEALSLLAEWGKEARLLAGGTDLTVYLKEDVIKPAAVIDLKDIEELKGITQMKDGVRIGALTTFTEILESDLLRQDYQMLTEAAATVASVGVRNRATLAGNICTAVPSLDSAPALLCYEAVLEVQNSTTTRQIKIGDWFLAPRKTALQADEILISIFIPKPPSQHAGIYLKLGRYRGEDLAQAGLSILLFADRRIRIAHCAVNPVPSRVPAIEKLLSCEEDFKSGLEKAKDLLEKEINPITDIRSSREYRVHICKVMLERGLTAVQDRLSGYQVDAHHILGG